MAMSGDIQQHHYSTSSVNSSSSRHQQSWSQQHYSGYDNDEVEVEEDHGAQLHQPLYPASEWDQKLDRMLDELQLSISPQRKAGTSASRIEGSAGSVGAKDTSSSYSVTSGSHHQSSRQTVSSSNTSQHQEHHRTTPSSARRVFDTSSIASNHSLDQGASPASIRAARSQSPEQHIPQTGSYNDGLFGKTLSRGGSISSVRSQSSQQQREYREYHSSNQTNGGGTVLVGMPSSTSVDDGRSDDDFQGATTSVSDRAKAWSSRGVAYNFASESTSTNKIGGTGVDGEVETVVKKSQLVKTSSNGQQPLGYGADEIDSALQDLMIVSEMATRSTQQQAPVFDNREKQSARTMVQSHTHQSQHVQSSGASAAPVVMQSGTVGSNSFSSSSSRQQFYSYSSSSKAATSESAEMPIQSTGADNRMQSMSISSSSLASATHHHHVIDYTRINQRQMRAAGIHSLSQQQLNSPICNFPDHEDYPMYNLRIIPESSGLLCNVAKHPQPMCNLERHPNFPLYAASPPCPAGSQATNPVCNIKVHPAILCNYPHHPDYPNFATGCPPADKESICNVPSHPELLCNLPKHSDYPKHASRCPPPEVEPICNIDLPKGHPRVICNFIRHPHYPKYCNPKATGQQPNTVCNVPGHVLDKCNIPEHPDFPDFKAKKPPVQIEGNINTPTPNEDLPLCTVPGHPMLLCNVRVHPDYPKFTHPELPEFSEAVAGLVCTIPSHPHDPIPLPSKCNIPGHPGYPDYMSLTEPQTEPFCDVPGHPFGLCNIQTHPQYPELMGPEDRDAAPYCFIPSHPELLCSIETHPDYPGYTTEGEVPPVPICNVPRHPPIPTVEVQIPSPTPSPLTARSPSPPVPDPGPIICNVHYHDDYPTLMGDSSPLSLPICTVPGHPALLCNVPKHPNFPDHVGEIGLNSPPQCNIPGHPQLLCNLPFHPDYPRLAGDCPAEPYCNLPTHPLTNKPKLYQSGTGSPLPNRKLGTPDPGLQAPPKKLDDLMATFNGGPTRPLTSTPRGDPQTIVFSPSPTVQLPLKADEPEVKEGEDEPLIVKETPKRPATKGTSGPPVYYPPDHKMFTKKDVPILSRTLEKKSKKMGGRSKGKMKFAAKHSAKASESESSAKGAYGGAAVIPICLPVCCAMPCVIM